MRIWLASASPRRRELLERLGAEVLVRPADLEEDPLPGEAPGDFVRRLALDKLNAAPPAPPGVPVVAADTIVVIDDRILGKPADTNEAFSMLSTIQGRWHTVHSGLALGLDGELRVGTEASRVKMAAMDPALIRWYIATGEPMDKAGAYALQGIGGLFVERVEGSCSNVVGLPLPLLRTFLADLKLLFPPC
jgi:septum formation protein